MISFKKNNVKTYNNGKNNRPITTSYTQPTSERYRHFDITDSRVIPMNNRLITTSYTQPTSERYRHFDITDARVIPMIRWYSQQLLELCHNFGRRDSA